MKLSIRTALIVAFVFASAAPLGVFWLWPHSAALTKEVDEVRERHLLLARNLGAALETYHRDVVAAFGAFAPSIAAGRAEEAKDIFSNLYFRHICVADPESGRVLRSYLDSAHKCPPTVPPDRMSMFRELSTSGDVALSGVFAPEGEEPRIYLVKDVGGHLVIGAIRTTFFQHLQRRISFGRKGHAAIVDGSGRVLAHPLDDWAKQAVDISKVSVVQRMLAGESGVDKFYSPALRGYMIAGFTAVAGTGWGVMVPQPLAELEEAAHGVHMDSLLVFAAGLVLSSIIAILVAAILARRIRGVVLAVGQIAQGERNVRVNEGPSLIGFSELSWLCDSFNHMAAEIESSREAAKKQTSKLESAVKLLRNEIDEREKAQIALRDSEKRFRNLFESEPIAVREEDFSTVKHEIDALGIDDEQEFISYLNKNPKFVNECADKIIVVDANMAAVSLHGLSSKEELLGKVTRNLSDQALEKVKRVLLAVFRGETQLEFETNVLPANGPERIIMARWSVAAGYEKTYGRVLFTSVDVTEHRMAEERLKQAQKMEAVGQLTGGVAHDFNNLLALIAGYAEMIADEPGRDPEMTDAIIAAVKRGADLTQRLLAFSRQQPLRPSVINVERLVSSISDLLQRSLGETIELDTIVSPELWQCLADEGQLENSILNLAINARDAMPNGGKLTIACANARLDDAKLRKGSKLVSGDFVVLSVSDNGVGMSPDVLERCLEPFFTTKDVGAGSGLGLSMVYGFAKQSGGHLTVYSEEGRGTTVKIYVPRASGPRTRTSGRKNDCFVPAGNGEVVLVIEDDREVRGLAIKMLKKLGYQVIEAPNLPTAREILETGSRVDIVLSDVVLPGGMSGMEFAEEARGKYDVPKFVFMSGYSAEAAVRNGYLKPETVLLNKPFELRQLARALRETLDLTEN